MCCYLIKYIHLVGGGVGIDSLRATTPATCGLTITMDDLQAPPSEPPGSDSEPTSTPLKSKALNSPSSWTPELRPAERLLIRPAEARQRMERFPQGPDARAFRRRFFPAATPEQWNDWRWQLDRKSTRLNSSH